MDILDIAVAKEKEAEDVQTRTRGILEITRIAVRAVYEAAEAGNVTCKEARKEIEKLRKPL